jgi:hypothetical protein
MPAPPTLVPDAAMAIEATRSIPVRMHSADNTDFFMTRASIQRVK